MQVENTVTEAAESPSRRRLLSRRRVALVALVIALVTSLTLGFGAFRWGGETWKSSEGLAFVSWLNQHGATAQIFSQKHPKLASTFGPSWPPPTPEQQAPALIAAAINVPLKNYGVPLAGYGAVFEQAGKRWGVNPFMLAAISGTESTFGRNACRGDRFNSFGIDACRGRTFDSHAAAIFYVAKLLRLSYLNQGLRTIDAIGSKYCPPCGSGWGRSVRYFTVTVFGGVAGVDYSSARKAVIAQEREERGGSR